MEILRFRGIAQTAKMSDKHLLRNCFRINYCFLQEQVPFGTAHSDKKFVGHSISRLFNK
jgi:hypothetical protein